MKIRTSEFITERKKIKNAHDANRNNLLLNLPDEMLQQILGYLNYRDLRRARLISQRMNNLSIFQQESQATQVAQAIIDFVVKSVVIVDPVNDAEIIHTPDGEKFNYGGSPTRDFICNKFKRLLQGIPPAAVAKAIVEIAIKQSADDPEKVKEFINQRGCMGQTFLHHFISTKDLKAIKILIEAGVDINALNAHDQPALFILFESNESGDPISIQLIDYLLKNKANFYYPGEYDYDNDRLSDAMDCWSGSYIEIMAFLIAKEAVPSDVFAKHLRTLEDTQKEIYDKYLQEYSTNVVANLNTSRPSLS